MSAWLPLTNQSSLTPWQKNNSNNERTLSLGTHLHISGNWVYLGTRDWAPKARTAKIERPKAARWCGYGPMGVPPSGEGSGEDAVPTPDCFQILIVKWLVMLHFDILGCDWELELQDWITERQNGCWCTVQYTVDKAYYRSLVTYKS